MELSLGGSFGGLSLLADLGDRIPDDRRPCQHLISSCPAKLVHPTCHEGIDYKTCFGLICADIQIQIAEITAEEIKKEEFSDDETFIKIEIDTQEERIVSLYELILFYANSSCLSKIAFYDWFC